MLLLSLLFVSSLAIFLFFIFLLYICTYVYAQTIFIQQNEREWNGFELFSIGFDAHDSRLLFQAPLYIILFYFIYLLLFIFFLFHFLRILFAPDSAAFALDFRAGL